MYIFVSIKFYTNCSLCALTITDIFYHLNSFHFPCHSGDKQDTKGTAFVVYEDIYDAKNAVEHLNGFNVCGRYLIVLYFQQSKMIKAQENKLKQQELDSFKAKFGVSS